MFQDTTAGKQVKYTPVLREYNEYYTSVVWNRVSLVDIQTLEYKV